MNYTHRKKLEKLQKRVKICHPRTNGTWDIYYNDKNEVKHIVKNCIKCSMMDIMLYDSVDYSENPDQRHFDNQKTSQCSYSRSAPTSGYSTPVGKREVISTTSIHVDPSPYNMGTYMLTK